MKSESKTDLGGGGAEEDQRQKALGKSRKNHEKQKSRKAQKKHKKAKKARKKHEKQKRTKSTKYTKILGGANHRRKIIDVCA